MKLIAYFKNKFIPLNKVQISPLDRGFIFGDSIYEVIPIYNNLIFHFSFYIKRFINNLKLVNIKIKKKKHEWKIILNKLIQMNNFIDGEKYIYLHVSRGTMIERNHKFIKNEKPTIFITIFKKNENMDIKKGISVMTIDDKRSGFCYIKNTNLIPNIFSYNEALKNGFDDALFIKNGYVMEATSSNIFIVANNTILTPPSNSEILSGTTRKIIINLAKKNNLLFKECIIPENQLFSCDEVFLTSSLKNIRSVISIDGRKISNGNPGKIFCKISEIFNYYINNI